MMNKIKHSAVFGAVLLICAAESQAAINWTYGSTTYNNGTGTAWGNTFASSSGGVTATAKAWSNTNDGTPGDVGNNASTPTLAATAANYKLETAYLGLYSGGLGVNNQDGTSSSSNGDQGDLVGTAPEHAIDNNQRYDSVLFSFTSAVNLTAMTTGYVSTDSDFTVWYYTGSGTPSTDLAGNTYGALGAGWNLLGSYNGGSSQGTTPISNSTGIYSSYWLIGAYNDTVGGYKDAGVSANNDFFKISGLTGSTKGVPEPGTLLLMSAGLIGLTRINRRRPANNA